MKKDEPKLNIYESLGKDVIIQSLKSDSIDKEKKTDSQKAFWRSLIVPNQNHLTPDSTENQKYKPFSSISLSKSVENFDLVDYQKSKGEQICSDVSILELPALHEQNVVEKFSDQKNICNKKTKKVIKTISDSSVYSILKNVNKEIETDKVTGMDDFKESIYELAQIKDKKDKSKVKKDSAKNKRNIIIKNLKSMAVDRVETEKKIPMTSIEKFKVNEKFVFPEFKESLDLKRKKSRKFSIDYRNRITEKCHKKTDAWINSLKNSEINASAKKRLDSLKTVENSGDSMLILDSLDEYNTKSNFFQQKTEKKNISSKCYTIKSNSEEFFSPAMKGCKINLNKNSNSSKKLKFGPSTTLNKYVINLSNSKSNTNLPIINQKRCSKSKFSTTIESSIIMNSNKISAMQSPDIQLGKNLLGFSDYNEDYLVHCDSICEEDSIKKISTSKNFRIH